MTPNEYQETALRFEADQTRSLARLANLSMAETKDSQLQGIRFAHACIGLAKQVGEVNRVWQKWIIHGKVPDQPAILNLMEEAGDILWYLAQLGDVWGFTLQQVIDANIAKLQTRYGGRHTEAAAQNRDLGAEMHAIADHIDLESPAVYQDGHGFGHQDNPCKDIPNPGLLPRTGKDGRSLHEEETDAIG